MVRRSRKEKYIFRYSDHKKEKHFGEVGSKKLFDLTWPASITT